MNIVTQLESRLALVADARIAQTQEKYLRNQFKFFGIKKPIVLEISKILVTEYPIKTESELINILNSLWEKSEREYHYSACFIAHRYSKLWTPSIFNLFEQMIRTHSWWDTVDTIAVHLVGGLLQKHSHLQARMGEWSADENLWIRRSALLFQLRYKHETNKELLFSYCQKMMHEKEFFIRKAIGWVLREYAKTDSASVTHFIECYKTNLSGLSIREAQKHIYSIMPS